MRFRVAAISSPLTETLTWCDTPPHHMAPQVAPRREPKLAPRRLAPPARRSVHRDLGRTGSSVCSRVRAKIRFRAAARAAALPADAQEGELEPTVSSVRSEPTRPEDHGARAARRHVSAPWDAGWTGGAMRVLR